MKFSDDTEAVLQFLDQATENNLRKRNDLGLILETGAELDNHELVSGIIFAGTSMWKVFSTLRKQKPGSEGYDTLEKEFANAMNHLRLHLAEIAGHAPEDAQQRFTDIYLGLTQGVIKNLVDLAHDLAALKDIQNRQKYGSAGDSAPEN